MKKLERACDTLLPLKILHKRWILKFPAEVTEKLERACDTPLENPAAATDFEISDRSDRFFVKYFPAKAMGKNLVVYDTPPGVGDLVKKIANFPCKVAIYL